MDISEFGDVTLLVALLFGATGLLALVFAYLGTFACGLARRGRPLTVAFTKAIPLSIVVWVLLALTLELAERAETSPDRTCQLSGNYALMVVDAEGSGWVYNRRNERQGGVKWDKDGIDGVQTLQVTHRFILGGRDSRGFRPSRDKALVNDYFVIDAQTERITKLSTLAQLQSSAAQLEIQAQLKPVYEVYLQRADVPMEADAQPRAGVLGAMFLLGVLLIYLMSRWFRAMKGLRVLPLENASHLRGSSSC